MTEVKIAGSSSCKFPLKSLVKVDKRQSALHVMALVMEG